MPLTTKQIDDCIDKIYGKHTGGGELRQLARLFSKSFWSEFEALLKQNFTHTTGPHTQEVRVGLGYIDKIPLAKMESGTVDANGNEITEKTEIGDAAFFFIDSHYAPDGKKVYKRTARGLILQAKQAKDGILPKDVPIVPLPKGQNDSTLKELALLETWPTFDLYFASGSKQHLQEGYEVRGAGGGGIINSPKAWYIGASPKLTTAWSPRWIAGPSSNGAPCVESLGSILHAVLENQGCLGGIEAVGKSFNFDLKRLEVNDFKLATTETPPNWDDLCHQLILACNSIDLPHHLFSKSARRGVGVAFYSNPLNLIFAELWTLLKSIGYRLGVSQPRRFPVVLVERQSGEGILPFRNQ